MPTQLLAPGTVLAGKLRVIRLLGAGGMGAVYEVEHELTKHRRALKLLHRGVMLRNPDNLLRFTREASAAGRIGSPHICETFDAGTLPTGEPYMLMERLRGEPFDQLLVRRGQLGCHEAIALIAQACEGMQAAHEAGIVHRDIKPANLFLSDGAPGLVKILDFGVSKFDVVHDGDELVTGEGSFLGTPLYMAPEQLRGERTVDARADVYALGMVLYECLAGRAAYATSSFAELVTKIQFGEYTPLQALRPDLSPALVAIVERALSRDRADRFPSARELRTALVAWRAEQGSGPLAALMLARRRPRWWGWAGAIALSVALTTLLGMPSGRRLERAAHAAGAAPAERAPERAEELVNLAPRSAARQGATLEVLPVASERVPSPSAGVSETTVSAESAPNAAARRTRLKQPAKETRASAYGLVEVNPF